MKDDNEPFVTLVQPKLTRVKFFAREPGAQYRPCNGTEGEYFWSMWCEECERDKAMNGTWDRAKGEPDQDDYCEILSRSFRDDEPLPEWTYGDDGQPKCTQFVPLGEKVIDRCSHTADMFEQPAAESEAARAGSVDKEQNL